MPHGNGKLDAFALKTVALENLEIRPDPAEVLRYLGYPAETPPHSRIAARIRQVLENPNITVRPQGIYCIHRVRSRGPRTLTLECGTRFAGPIGEYLGSIGQAAIFLATAGAEPEQMAEASFRSGDTLGGLIFNALGSHIAEAALERITEDLSRQVGSGEALTLPFSPGYCGISLSQQRTVFRLIDASRVGVKLLPTLIMKPVKSISGLIGIGPKEALAALGNPCDRCSRANCRMRR